VTLELDWPADHPWFPAYGCVIPRKDLDMQISERAQKAGATVWCEADAAGPILEGGVIAGVQVHRKDRHEDLLVSAPYVIVADGSLSRFGRALGNARDRRRPMGLAIRGYYRTDRDHDPYIESHLDIRRGNDILPGYGWVFPVGDGTVNVGVGLLSTFGEWRSVNTTELMEAFVDQAGPEWGFSAADSCGPARGGKLPMGLAVGPRYGVNWLVVGDAGGAINPFNGEGIAYALETGRTAAEHIHQAIDSGDGRVLARYPKALDDEYADYFRVARAFVRAIGHPALMTVLTQVGFRSRPLMEWVLRVMANLLRPEDAGVHEKVYRAFEKLVEIGPEP
jgi:geranylgeranyl reductase family protein